MTRSKLPHQIVCPPVLDAHARALCVFQALSSKASRQVESNGSSVSEGDVSECQLVFIRASAGIRSSVLLQASMLSHSTWNY